MTINMNRLPGDAARAAAERERREAEEQRQREIDEIREARERAQRTARLWVVTAVEEVERDARTHRGVVRQLAADLRAGKLDGDRKRAKALAHAADELAQATKLEALADALQRELEGSR